MESACRLLESVLTRISGNYNKARTIVYWNQCRVGGRNKIENQKRRSNSEIEKNSLRKSSTCQTISLNFQH